MERRNKVRIGSCLWVAWMALTSPALAGVLSSGPFEPEVRIEPVGPREVILNVMAAVPAGHYLYAESWTVTAEPGRVEILSATPAETIFDPFTEAEAAVYRHGVTNRIRWTGIDVDGPAVLTVTFQGCDEEVCYFPGVRRWQIDAAGELSAWDEVGSDVPDEDTGWRVLQTRFVETGRETGYWRPGPFLEFLDRAGRSGAPASPEGGALAALGLVSAALVILLGGLGLNLTPCVLPMIPVTLAVIGAQSSSLSRGHRIGLGIVYGAAMAATYGALGLVVVLTGATFGAFHASPWFNGVLAVVFVGLALAMFDVLHIDFTRLRGRLPATGQGIAGRKAAVFALGCATALLAGACVAPVVISVLVWSASLVAQGVPGGWLPPFLLGIGMALPWPFAAAGMSFLPKPGRWMTWVRNGFGVLILLMAFYYGRMAWRMHRQAALPLASADSVSSGFDGRAEAERLTLALRRALSENRPVFIDFWATWCRNCMAMEASTFRDPEVVERLRDYEFVKFQAERPAETAVREVLEAFGVLGLPTYLVLHPADERGPAHPWKETEGP